MLIFNRSHCLSLAINTYIKARDIKWNTKTHRAKDSANGELKLWPIGFIYSGVAITLIISVDKLLHKTKRHTEKLINNFSEVPSIFAISKVSEFLNFSLKLGSTEFK